MNKQLIYAVEDDESIRELIKYALIEQGYQVETFDCAEKMLEQMHSNLPLLIVLDVMLPGMDGLEALKKIREQYKNVNIKVIILTAKNRETNIVSGLESGADDYMTKPFSVLELVARIKANLREYSVSVGGGHLIFEAITLKPRSRSVTVDGEAVKLTNIEFQLLETLMRNVGNVLEREKLLNDIWGFESSGESRTIDIHIKNLRSKLGIYGDCIASIRGVGYVLKHAQEPKDQNFEQVEEQI